jgi:hypothetical protein
VSQMRAQRSPKRYRSQVRRGDWSDHRWTWVVGIVALGCAASGIAVALKGGSAVVSGGLVAIAPTVVIMFQSVLTRQSLDAARQEAAVSRQQAEAAESQAEAAKRQAAASEQSIAALSQPLVIEVPPGIGRVPSGSNEWSIESGERKTECFFAISVRNVGRGTALLTGLGLHPAVEGAWGGRFSQAVVPPGERSVLDFVIPKDRADLAQLVSILSSPTENATLWVEVGYTDTAGRRQPVTRLHLNFRRGPGWSVRQTQFVGPEQDTVAMSGPSGD